MLAVSVYMQRFVAVATATLALLAIPASAAALERTERNTNGEPTGLVAVQPARIELDVVPGTRQVVRMTLVNDADFEVDVTVTPTDLEAAADPRNFVDKTEDGEFGAGDWLFPEITHERLKPWELIEFDLVIDPPLTAAVGTNLAGLTVNTAPAKGVPGTEDQQTGLLSVEALVQVFLTVPGPVKHDLRIEDVDVRDRLVLGGQRFVVWDVTFRNAGTVNEHVTGSIDIRSIFGNSAHRERIDETIVLRGATRQHRLIWRDLPWVGAFTPNVTVRGDDAKKVTAVGERIVVFPWWIPVVFLVLVATPMAWIWWRRRQEWRLYLDDQLDDELGDADWYDGDPAHHA